MRPSRYRPRPAAAFFDLDKTVVAKSSTLAFGRGLYREGLISRAVVLKGAYAQMAYQLFGANAVRMERTRVVLLQLTRGWEADRVQRLVRETLQEVIAPRARVDADGRYDGTLEFYCYGEQKAAAIREEAEARGLDLADSYAYSDSITDLPMLGAVGHAVAVNPDRELRARRDRRRPAWAGR